jgi:hypothetical protein
MYVHRTLIVSAAQVALARSLCSQLAGPPGAGMFTAELNASGVGVPTHYASAGLIEDQFAGALSNASILFGACSAAGISVTLPQCTALLAASDVSAEKAQVAIARVGLKLIPGSP